MRLKEFLHKNLMTIQEFSSKTGISEVSIYRYLRGHPCHIKRAFFIEKFTEGAVTALEMIEECPNEAK